MPDLPSPVSRDELEHREAAATALIETLSRREYQVLHLLVDGQSNKAIARVLGISQRTIEIHRANMIARLGLHNSGEAAVIGALAGLGSCPYLG